MLKHSVKLRRYSYAVLWQHATTTQHHCNDVILLNALTYDFGQMQCKLPDDARRPKHVGAFLSLF
jgi:hypothetical protein